MSVYRYYNIVKRDKIYYIVLKRIITAIKIMLRGDRQFFPMQWYNIPIVSSKFSPKEQAVIVEFISQQGESISTVIRKASIILITQADLVGNEHLDYQFENWNDNDYSTVEKRNTNTIRKILGWYEARQ